MRRYIVTSWNYYKSTKKPDQERVFTGDIITVSRTITLVRYRKQRLYSLNPSEGKITDSGPYTTGTTLKTAKLNIVGNTVPAVGEE